MLGFLEFFRRIQLKTRIDHIGIALNFFPLYKRKVPWEEVEKTEVIKYSFVGGWGIRMWTKYGTVYNIRGNIGLAVSLKNGKKFLIGTQKPQELKAFMTSLKLRGIS